jgi:hypothetical protein
MPHLIKIGYSKDPYKRSKELSRSTGVPTEWIVEMIIETDTPQKLEKLLHKEFSRYHHNKEYFKYDLEKSILKIKDYLYLNTKYSNKISGPAVNKYLTYEELEDIKKKKVRDEKILQEELVAEKRKKQEEKIRKEKFRQEIKKEMNNFYHQNIKEFVLAARKTNDIAVKHMSELTRFRKTKLGETAEAVASVPLAVTMPFWIIPTLVTQKLLFDDDRKDSRKRLKYLSDIEKNEVKKFQILIDKLENFLSKMEDKISGSGLQVSNLRKIFMKEFKSSMPNQILFGFNSSEGEAENYLKNFSSLADAEVYG